MNRKSIILFIVFLIGFWILFFVLQKTAIYNRTLGLVAKTWDNQNGERKLVHKPYEQVDNNKMIRWDAVHYQLIKNYGYDLEKSGGDYIFAFFPLFPTIWKISYLSPIGVLFLNYLLFSIAIFVLVRLLSDKKDIYNNILLALSLPSLIIFLIPYTEATFLIALSIGVYGFLKNKYWIFFIGFLLASFTRPCFVFLTLSIIGTEFLFFLNYKKIVLFIKNVTLRIAPLVIGTGIVSVIQLLSGSKSIFTFLNVQKYWNHVLSIPHQLRDWSHEGYGIHIGIFIIIIPLTIFLAKQFYDQLINIKKSDNKINQSNEFYLTILSAFYLIGTTIFIIFFQGGDLHGLFRYTLNTPFFFILLFGSFGLVKKTSFKSRLYSILTLSALSIFVMGYASYSSRWNFSDLGFFILLFTIALWLFQDKSSSRYYKLALYLNFCLNILWTTYMFNSYIIDGWIFA